MLYVNSILAIVFCFLGSFFCLGQSNQNYIVDKKLYTIGSGVSAQDIYCVAQDNKGFIWLGTKGGLSRFDGNHFKMFSKSDGLVSNLVSNIVIDNNNRIFIEHGNQWQPFDIDKRIDVFDANRLEVITPKCAASNYPNEIKTDLKQGRNWRIKYLPMNLCWDKELSKEKDALLYVTQKGSGQLLITKENGVYYIEKGIRVKIFEGHEFYDNGNTGVNHFYKDSNDNLWICVKKGIYQVRIVSDRFQKFFTRQDFNMHVIPQSRGIWVSQEKNQNVVNAVVLNGMVSNRGVGNFVRRMGLGWGLLGIGDSLLYAINNRIYFSLHNADQSQLLCELPIPFDDVVNCMYALNDSVVVVGSSSGVVLMNRMTGAIQVVTLDKKRFPAMVSAYRIFKSSKGLLVVAENGLYLIEARRVVDYFGSEAKEGSHHIPIQSILDAHEDKQGVLWIASNGYGLCRWDWNAGKKPMVFNKSEGLPSDIIYRIEEDGSGNIWMSTDDGLCRYSLKNNLFKVFTVADGLPSQEFNRTSSFRDANGRLYFGGVNGVISFDPREFNVERNSNGLLVTAFARFASKESGFMDESILFNGNPEIRIHPDDYMVKLDFALLDYGFSKPLYWYRIKGAVDNWYLLETNSLILGSLDYGSYVLEIKALSQSEFGIPQLIEIPIVVEMPYYLSFWFLAGSIVFLILIVVIAIRWRGMILQRRNVFLEGAILERTSDLKVALNEKDDLLKELHHRVKNNLQLVISLLDLQKEEVDDEKSKEVLVNSQMRLMSIALIHQHFYKSDDLAFINFHLFLEDLLRQLEGNFGQNMHSISFEYLPQEKQLDIDVAIPLGMIINEMVTNSFKHIHPSNYPIRIDVVMKENAGGDEIELSYIDNGQGIQDLSIFDNPQTLGLKLIKGLTSQIRGTVEYTNDLGSQYFIRFKRKLNKKN
jgi:two-component sensor histidine kinase